MDGQPREPTQPGRGLFERPATFLATHGIFPLFAVGAMLYQWWLIKGEVHGTAAWLSLGLWAVPLLLAALGWACWGWMRSAGRRRTNAWVMSGFAVAGVAFLWGLFPAMKRVMEGLPDAAPTPMGIFSVFLGMLPMVYAGVGRWMDAGARKGKRWWLWTLGIGLGGVLALALGIWPVSTSWGGKLFDRLELLLGGLFVTVCVLVYVLGTLAGLFLLLRISYWLGRKRREGPHREAWRIGEALLFGLALPLGGLALNLKIPFPADFANPWTWGIAVAAGVVMLTPLRGGLAGLAAWAGRWAVGVYVLYFFLLFLPFLPLVPWAVALLGAGILMVAPLLLFQFWCRDIAESWRTLRGRYRALPLAALAAAAALLLPALWAADIEVERAQLKALVAWHAGENFDEPEIPPPMGMRRAARIMERVNDYRFGVETPFLTAWRTWRVYGGMHMANPLRQALNRRILGREVADPRDWEKAKRNFLGEAVFSASRGRGMEERFTVPLPTDDFAVARVDGDGAGGYAVGIVVRGRERPEGSEWNPDQELVLDFRLPAGAWLEGARLKMPGGGWKDARASERKAAEWIYLKIAHQRAQDPLLVTMDTPAEGRLRLFPVPPDGSRELELAVRLPAAGAAAAVAEFRVPEWKRSRTHWEKNEETGRWQRKDIADEGDGTGWIPANAPEGAGEAASGMQSADGAEVTRIAAAWFDGRAGEAVQLAPGGEETAFDPADPNLARKLRRVLRQAWRRLETGGPSAGTPRVAFSGGGEPALSDAEKRMLRREFPGLEWLGDETLDGWFFLATDDGRNVPVPWRRGQDALVFARLAGAAPVGGAWAEGAKAWEIEERAFRYPGEDHRAELLAKTRETGVLTTQSACIVLENTIQEKELTLDEKRALAADKSLDFHETAPEPPVSTATPEPGTLALLALGAATLAAATRCRGRSKK
ncbi:MAG: PEP-CTERM sorting domain-containing protein [Kiritimatiellae bacterium]|nr:PEP-CTERM sorting domain-containing protein [Kiritimatiellia bacterium]